ncbi:hypothetical protein L226DRAFT_577145 [Lentinus tigrinus ALCF2SS1-7]|uniref:uncharacterized protein n=1 Tax=Lentinus tigrinus ALCF2SS1-7 TaxID=1328758 RepID=UPI0011663E4E|nr:hypothetical protein L226DRAFT_577145 [Lentinus tigrinus ALCF2SS1-7]
MSHPPSEPSLLLQAVLAETIASLQPICPPHASLRRPRSIPAMCPVPLCHLPPLPEDPTPAPYSIQIMPPTPSPLHALDNTAPMSVRPELHVQITHTALSRNEEHTIPQVIRIPDTDSAPSSGTTPTIMPPSPSIKFSLPNSVSLLPLLCALAYANCMTNC